MLRGITLLVCALVGARTFGACGGVRDAKSGPPPAEFLFAAGDSTYWVRSADDGLRLRSAPILLTQIEGAFYEVFIAEDGVDFEDAAFSVARIYARNVTRKDSVALFDDGTVMREATAWRLRHPGETPLDAENEQLPDDPNTVVSEEIEILDVHGPWVTFNHLLDIDVADRDPHRHAGRRYVVDVRTGKRASLATLFGDTEARRLIAAARASFKQLTDSIRAAGDDRAEMARETLDSFRFDSTSFGLTDIAREPAVAFMVPGNGIDGEALALNLPPIAVKSPDWWKSVRSTLAEWSRDSSVVRWTRKGYDVIARPASEGEALALALAPSPIGAGKEWPVATVPAPAYQLIPLDAPVVSKPMRDALARAFDASSALDGVVQTASNTQSSRARSAVRVRPVSRRVGSLYE